MATQLSGLSQKVYEDRYALKDAHGVALEHTPEETWARVAKAIAAVEATPQKREYWADEFQRALEGFKFVPGGRILSGAGSGVPVTFYNCFVIPSPEDSRGGILDSVKLMVEIMSRSGGVGVNISSLRPRGTYVKGVNGTASGAVSFGGLYSYATGLIIQGGSRRGALMLMLNDDHPDIEEFITVKRTMGVVTNANLSVCMSDRFMDAVRADADWDLQWGGRVYKTVKAKHLWNLICESAWASGEPGTFFIERANKRSNTWYFEPLISTNPCVVGDTRVMTDRGLVRIADLASSERPFRASVDARLHPTARHALVVRAFRTGRKAVYRLETVEGYSVTLTADHRVRTERGFVAARDLIADDRILLHNRGGGFGTSGDEATGRMLGWFIGGGHFNRATGKAVLSFFGDEKRELAPLFATAVARVVDAHHRAWATVRAYAPVQPIAIAGRDEARVASVRLAYALKELGVHTDEKLRVPETVFTGSQAMQRGFLAALFTADGQVLGTRDRNASVRLTSISIKLLEGAQLLLLNFGIPSTIYRNRRPANMRMLPDGHGSYRSYTCHAQHDLVVSKSAIAAFAARINFLTHAKRERLAATIAGYQRRPYQTTFTVRFTQLVPAGTADVYDLTEPLTHSFSANGLVVHNCGEQPLGAWSVCNLGSINVAAFAQDRGGIDYPATFDWETFRTTVRTAVRFLDNVIDATYYPYEENRVAQMGIRRTGLGFMGLGDLLIRLHLRYGSPEGIAFTRDLYRTMRDESYRASVEIAREKGPFPKYDAEKYPQGWFIRQLPDDIQQGIRMHGIRNAVLLTQAPTGTTSLLSGVSSGIEPVFAFSFTRKDRIGEHEVYHPLYEQWKQAHADEEKPAHFVSAMELAPEEHVAMQAAAQEFIDSSISKTVNAPNEHTQEAVQRLYMSAYEQGCKGVTYFRDGSRNEAVLSVKKPTADSQQPQAAETPKPMSVLEPRPRPEVMNGRTYKVTTAYGTLYVTINSDEHGQPFEVFATIGKSGGFFAEESEGICRLVSLGLRSGIPVTTIVDQIKGIRGPMPSFGKHGMILSVPDAIAQVLEEHARQPQPALALGYAAPATLTDGKGEALHEPQALILEHAIATAPIAAPVTTAEAEVKTLPKKAIANVGWAPECPTCGTMLQFQEGCMTCRGCGYSKCA